MFTHEGAKTTDSIGRDAQGGGTNPKTTGGKTRDREVRKGENPVGWKDISCVGSPSGRVEEKRLAKPNLCRG